MKSLMNFIVKENSTLGIIITKCERGNPYLNIRVNLRLIKRIIYKFDLKDY